MRRELLKTRLWKLEVDSRSKVVFLNRTGEPLGNLHELEEENRKVIERFRVARAPGIVVDVRLARPCNSPEFESAMALLRHETYLGFSRVALLVRTAVGRLQVSRLGVCTSDRLATTDESRAVAFAAGQSPARAAN